MATQRNRSTVEDGLKVIFSVGEWDERGRTNSEIAARLNAATSTVSELVRKLSDDGLVRHEPYGGVELTDDGLSQALQMVRRHRLLETFLVSELGYSWDQVHDEAEVLEHAVSDLLLERVDERLGHPWRDPHGDAIPTPDGILHLPEARPLGALDEGDRGFVARILDEEPELLRWFDEQGIHLDTELVVQERKPFGGALQVGVGPKGTRHTVDLGIQAEASLWISANAPLPGVTTPYACHYADCRHIGPPRSG